MISSVQNLLGLTVITAVLSELGFFIDAGKSHEYIMRFYFDARSRIESRMKGNWFGRSILDSSPNSLDNPIDKYIWQDAPKDPSNYIVTGSRWDWAPEDFKNLDDKFPIFLGAPGIPPSIPDEEAAVDYDPTTLLWAPRELKTIFENDLVKALKDVAGRPSGDQKKLLNENAVIENMFEDKLNNLYTHIYVPAALPPEHAIWEMIYPYFFRQVGEQLKFYYRPEIPRVFSIDLAEKGDSASISIAHTELMSSSEILTVYDITVVISPLKGDINLDAIKYFIEDCSVLGNMTFIAGSFDQFQSVSSRQHLERVFGFKIQRVSVDLTMDPYKNMIADIRGGRIKMGKNIYVKNNLKSLIITPRRNSKKLKIDHTLGEAADIEGDSNWDTSLIGYHAKDATDAMAQAGELLRQLGPPAHFHNNFLELVSQSNLLEDEDNFYEYLSQDRGLQRVVKYD